MTDSDANAERNVKLKSAMRQTQTPLSSAPQVVGSPKLKNPVTKYNTKSDPYKQR